MGNFQIPRGTYKVYEKKEEILTYIGADFSEISEGEDVIRLEIGKTHDILCMFIIKDYKNNNDHSQVELEAIFENRKDKPISIEWIEKFSDSPWEITKSKIRYEQLDAHRALFIVDVPANSKKQISFSVVFEKD